MKNNIVFILTVSIFYLTQLSIKGQSAIFDVNSDSQGALLPRMTLGQRNAIVEPAHSLIIYQVNNEPGYYYNSGSPASPIWVRLSTGNFEDCESRIPIDAIPFTISEPGSYYVTGHLMGTSNNDGITIESSNVTIDLNGFTVESGGGSSGNGVFVNSTYSNIQIKNGAITNWPENGLLLSSVRGSIFSHLTISSNNYDGIKIGDDNIIMHCVSDSNGFDGIDAGKNCRLIDCIASANSDDGIETDHTASLSGCKSFNNGDKGITAGTSSVLKLCSSRDNIDYGFDLGNNSISEQNVSQNNQGGGFHLNSGCQVFYSTARANTGHGFLAEHRCTFKNNLSDNNSMSGFFSDANAVLFESNQSVSNGQYGFDIQSNSDCVVIKNNASGNSTANYIISASNSAGPVVGPDLSSITNPLSNISL